MRKEKKIFAFLFKAPHLQSQTIFAKHYQGALQFFVSPTVPQRVVHTIFGKRLKVSKFYAKLHESCQFLY